jgi:hypothetical protein
MIFMVYKYQNNQKYKTPRAISSKIVFRNNILQYPCTKINKITVVQNKLTNKKQLISIRMDKKREIVSVTN